MKGDEKSPVGGLTEQGVKGGNGVLQGKDSAKSGGNQINIPKTSLSAISQNIQPQQPKEKVIRADDYRVTLTSNIPRPEVALRFGDAVIATSGNLSLITGKAKSRKTFFTTILATAACKFGGLYNYRSELPDRKSRIVIFDTEESEYYAQLVLKRIEKLGNAPDELNMNKIVMYALRPLTPLERMDFIHDVIYSMGDIGIVIIDGVRDLLYDINDPVRSTELVTNLMRWSYERNIHIINVLHQNKSDNNARGHLGSELVNKCETVLSVSRADGDDNISIVTAEYCRSLEPKDFYFEIDETGLPVETAHAEVRTSTKTFDVRDIPEGEAFAMFAGIFNGKEISYAELVNQTKYHFPNVFDKKIGDNKAKDFITHAKNKGWILQDGEKKPYRLGRIDEELPDKNGLPF